MAKLKYAPGMDIMVVHGKIPFLYSVTRFGLFTVRMSISKES